MIYQINCTSDYNKLLNSVKNCPSIQYPQYVTFIKRLQSLNKFPSSLPDKLQLSEAGFFGKTRDSVQCFHCGLILSNWLIGDCPFREHAKFSNNCTFLLLSKGVNFINDVTNKFNYKNLSFNCCNMHNYSSCDEVDK
jgi:hypothetical protein